MRLPGYDRWLDVPDEPEPEDYCEECECYPCECDREPEESAPDLNKEFGGIDPPDAPY